MKEEVFKSRGILNLIPDNLFQQNKATIEQIILKLKD